MTKLVNLYGGPGTGKSTTAAGVFMLLKQRGYNAELVTEFAKDVAWEHQGQPVPDVMKAQELVFAQQHWRIRRLINKVDYIVTDSPLLMNLMYVPEDFELPALRDMIKQAHRMYTNREDIFLMRTKDYNPAGRWQTEDEARALDLRIKSLLNETGLGSWNVRADIHAPSFIVEVILGK